MGYAKDQPIRIGEFNGFAGATGTGSYGAEPSSSTVAGGGNLGILYGSGYGSYGYNQSALVLSPVSANDPIRSSGWTALRNVLAMVRTHQTGTVDAEVPPSSELVVDHIVRAHESSPPTSNPYNFTSVINLALANRFTMTGGTLVSLRTMTRATGWGSGGGTIQGVLRTTWADADSAGFFFNTGGYIRLDFTQPVSTSQDSDWSDAFTNRIASIRFGAKTTLNTGSVPISSNFGFYNCTTSYQQAWLGTGANGFVNAHYSANTVLIEAKTGGTAANGRPGVYVDFRITLTDAHTGPIDGVSAGTAATISSVKDTVNLTTVPSTPASSTITPW